MANEIGDDIKQIIKTSQAQFLNFFVLQKTLAMMIGKSLQKWPRKWKRKTKMSNNKQNIEKKASKLINDYSIEIGRPIKPPIPVFDIVEFLGMTLIFEKMVYMRTIIILEGC